MDAVRRSSVEPWLRSLVDQSDAGDGPRVEDLVRALGEAGEARRWVTRARFDPAVPYGRAVVFAERGVEYAGVSSPMTVYDVEHRRTQWLDVDCGAWARPAGDAKVLGWAAGFVRGQ